MKDKIKRHIHEVLYKKGFDEEFEEEIANACYEEYDKSISRGLSSKEAYKNSIKDFDNEYLDLDKSEYRWVDSPLVDLSSLIFSFIIILGYTLSNSFMKASFSFNVNIILLPTALALLIKGMIIIIGFKGSPRRELKAFILSLGLFLPFLFIYLRGDIDSLENYLISLLPVASLYLLIAKGKKASIKDYIIGATGIIILVTFSLSNSSLSHVLDLSLYIIIELLVIALVAFLLFKQRGSYIMSLAGLGVGIALVGISHAMGGYYNSYKLISIFAIVIMLALFINSMTKKYTCLESLGKYLALAFSVDNLIGLIVIGAKGQIYGLANTEFFFNVVILISLVVVEEYLNRSEFNLKSKAPLLALSLILMVGIAVALNINPNSFNVDYLEEAKLSLGDEDINKLVNLGYDRREINYLTQGEYEEIKDISILKKEKNTNLENGIESSLTITYYKNLEDKRGALAKASFKFDSNLKERYSDLACISFDNNLLISKDLINGDYVDRFSARLIYDANEESRAVEIDNVILKDNCFLVSFTLPEDQGMDYKDSTSKLANEDFILSISLWLAPKNYSVNALSVKSTYYHSSLPAPVSFDSISAHNSTIAFKNDSMFKKYPSFTTSNSLVLMDAVFK